MLYYASYCSILRVQTMHKTARQKYLIDILSEKGQITISELVDRLQVSADTLRRDLSDLEKQQRLFAGSATVSLLERYRADIAVLGTCALHADLGLSASQEADAEVKRAMLAASAEHWLVADHMKLNHCEPWLVAGLADIHQLFLDRPWDELKDNDSIQLHIADA